jgi:hypothetical protein
VEILKLLPISWLELSQLQDQLPNPKKFLGKDDWSALKTG